MPGVMSEGYWHSFRFFLVPRSKFKQWKRSLVEHGREPKLNFALSSGYDKESIVILCYTCRVDFGIRASVLVLFCQCPKQRWVMFVMHLLLSHICVFMCLCSRFNRHPLRII